jgi:hypothetical protein
MTPECSGVCVTATDVGMPEYEPHVHTPDPACPVHGDPTPEQVSRARWDGWRHLRTKISEASW